MGKGSLDKDEKMEEEEEEDSPWDRWDTNSAVTYTREKALKVERHQLCVGISETQNRKRVKVAGNLIHVQYLAIRERAAYYTYSI